jgi:hypothetical protein
MDTKRHARFLRPGHAVTGDRTRNSKGAGFEFVHTIVDDCSRLAYAEVADDERAATVSAFTERALDWFLCRGIVCERLLTDNAWSYTKNKGLAELLDRRAIAHRRTKPYSPKTNGKVERLHQTMDREWARGLTLPLERGPSSGPGTLARALQHPQAPQRDRQPAADQSRSQGVGARQLVRGRSRRPHLRPASRSPASRRPGTTRPGEAARAASAPRARPQVHAEVGRQPPLGRELLSGPVETGEHVVADRAEDALDDLKKRVEGS